jgi:thiol-disulfide isomerase/thioredoxin
MQKIITALFIIIPVLTGCLSGTQSFAYGQVSEQAAQTSAGFSEPSTWLLGYFSREQMMRPPHSSWFLKGYDEYMFSQESVDRLMEIPHKAITIKIILGTWCPDSRREVPRFMRILDHWKFPGDRLTIIGVDDAKLSPVGEYEKLDIQRVPTFIIFMNNVEAGRIIENPVTSLEQDMVNILTQSDQKQIK